MNPDWDLEDESKLLAIPAIKDLSLKVKSGGKDLVSKPQNKIYFILIFIFIHTEPLLRHGLS